LNLIKCRDNSFYYGFSLEGALDGRYPVRNYLNGVKEKGELLMANKKGISSETHTQKQMDDYANQNNRNNKAYQARIANEKKTKTVPSKCVAKKRGQKQAELEKESGTSYPLDWMCYSNPYDFD
jgi:hypothetical protein